MGPGVDKSGIKTSISVTKQVFNYIGVRKLNQKENPILYKT